MKTELNTPQGEFFEKIEEKVPYFMEYTREIVIQVITRRIDIQEMKRQVAYIYEVVEQNSQKIDERYERGDYGRPGIMDGGPNYINLFSQERDRCINILEQGSVKI